MLSQLFEKRIPTLFLGVISLLFALTMVARADDPITFTNIASDPNAGLDYQRAKSAGFASVEALRQQSLVEPITMADFIASSFRPYGQPGVAILDFDGDDDLDIYVTNGPGAPNSLFSNQLMETGETIFMDVAAAAGVAATDQDGMGVCYGDIDNDGDEDLLVLGRDEPNRLFENQGDGTFAPVGNSGLDADSLSSPACSMGDVNNDGLLDILVGNSFNHDNFVACFVEPFALTQHNQLFLNQGANTFADVSDTSGIQDLAGFPPEYTGGAGITWAVAMVDIDQDGDLDLIFGDDQCAMDNAKKGGLDRGFIHVLLNDGTGHFVDQPIIINPQASGSWMGLSFGDFNCDGHLDIFGSNFGDYSLSVTSPAPFDLGDEATRWLLGNGDGTFTDPVVAEMATVFGWGTGVFDYDNDGDQDIIYHGGMDMNVVKPTDNPGVLLQNQGCTAEFVIDTAAIQMNHQRREVLGVALGDLNRDGFVDIVTTAGAVAADETPLLPAPRQYGSDVPFADIFNPLATFVSIFDFNPDGTMTWNGTDFLQGDLTVELNSADNGHQWIQIKALGSVGLTDAGKVNRDGIGAIIAFTPENGETVMVPVEGGSSFAAQHSLEANFGLGGANQGSVEILWPGGVRNRLDKVKKSERIVFPEIPCNFAADWESEQAYMTCVNDALHDFVAHDILTKKQAKRFRKSALKAFQAQ